MQVELRVRNVDLADTLRGYIEQRLDSAVSRFGDQVGRIVVRVSGLNGSNGGTRKRCRISAELKAYGRIVVQEIDLDLYAAIDRAAARVGRLLVQRFERMWEVEIWHANRPAA